MKLSNAQAEIIARQIHDNLKTEAVGKIPSKIRAKIEAYQAKAESLSDQKKELDRLWDIERNKIKTEIGFDLFYFNTLDQILTRMVEKTMPSFSSVLAEVTITAAFSKNEDFTTFAKNVTDKIKNKK